MKKITSLLMAILMLATCVLPVCATSAVKADESKLPVIYIVGKQNTPVYKLDENGNFALDENGKRIAVDNVNTPMGMSRGDYIKSQLEPVLSKLGPAIITNDYDEYLDALIGAVAPIYEDLVLDGNAEDPDGSIDWDYSVQQPSYGAGGLKYYYFRYDWRYSPYDIADELHRFVEYVCEKEGVDKVNIHARCYGSNVAMAYIAKSEAGLYGDIPFRVNNICLNTTPLDGYIAIGALMSGQIEFDAETIDRFVTFYLNNNDLFDDPMLEDFLTILVSLVNQVKILGLGTLAMTAFYNKIAEELIPRAALVCYGSFPSYWSMIGARYYEKARATVFNTEERRTEYAVFIEKLDNYYNLIGAIEEETGKPLYASLIKRCEEKFGMKTAVFAKYGYATVPLFEDSDITGDARGTVTELSLGAIGTVVGETFTEKQLNELKAMPDYNEKYLSADKKVYAGTCLLPETTWFSKNLYHDQLTQIDPVATAFFLSDGQLTVNDERFPQFHEYVDGQFVPVTEEDETNDLWSNNFFDVIFRFFRKLIDLIKSLFNKAPAAEAVVA